MPYKRQRLINVDRLRVANSLEFVGKYVFPSIDGTSTYVLATDGSGQLYWSEGGNANLNPWVVKTTNYTATEGDRIIADSSTGTFTIYLPSSPAIGDSVAVTDGALFASTSTYVDPSGGTIEDDGSVLQLDLSNVTVEFIYDGSTWQVTSTVGPVGPVGPTGPQGVSGPQGPSGALSAWARKTSNYTAVNGDRIIADTSGGTFTVSLPATPTAGWYVVIGGVTMTLSAFSGNHPNGTDWNFIFDNPSGPLPSTVTLTSNTGYTNIWKRLSWSGDTW